MFDVSDTCRLTHFGENGEPLKEMGFLGLYERQRFLIWNCWIKWTLGITRLVSLAMGARSPRNPAGVHGAHEIRQGCTEPTKSGRGARSPWNPAEGYFPIKIEDGFLMKYQLWWIWTKLAFLTKLTFGLRNENFGKTTWAWLDICKVLGHLDTFRTLGHSLITLWLNHNLPSILTCTLVMLTPHSSIMYASCSYT
jgi:hypothetical protein